MFAVEENVSGKYVEVRLTGKLTKEAYDAFVPFTEEQIKEKGKVRMLVVMHDFHGWDLAAVWEDSKFAIKHFRDIERLCIVGESKWEKWMTSFCRPFTKAKIKYFDVAEIDQARQWMEKEHIPLHHYLLKQERILILSPEDKITVSDFQEVSNQVDPFIEANGTLNGLMIEAQSFPGWENASSMMAHFRFVKDHHKDIKRVALVSDDDMASHMPKFASHFVSSELKHFKHEDKAKALDWLAGIA